MAEDKSTAVDQDNVEDLFSEFAQMVIDAGEVGFMMTYSAKNEEGAMGRISLAGAGISNDQLGQIFARALDHNEEHGDTL